MNQQRCAYCGDVIGVYEPAWLIRQGERDLPVSLLTARAALQTPGALLVHEGCYTECQANDPER